MLGRWREFYAGVILRLLSDQASWTIVEISIATRLELRHHMARAVECLVIITYEAHPCLGMTRKGRRRCVTGQPATTGGVRLELFFDGSSASETTLHLLLIIEQSRLRSSCLSARGDHDMRHPDSRGLQSLAHSTKLDGGSMIYHIGIMVCNLVRGETPVIRAT